MNIDQLVVFWNAVRTIIVYSAFYAFLAPLLRNKLTSSHSSAHMLPINVNLHDTNTSRSLTAILILRFFLDLRETVMGGLQLDSFGPEEACKRTTPIDYDLRKLVTDMPTITERRSGSDSQEV